MNGKHNHLSCKNALRLCEEKKRGKKGMEKRS